MCTSSEEEKTTGSDALKQLLYLALAFYGGFCSMGLEMTAARLLAPYFGTSNYIWTNVIGIILLALSLGYYLGGRLADRSPKIKTLAGCLVIGGLLGMPIPYILEPLAGALLPPGLGLDNAFLIIFKGSFLGAALFAPAIVIMGMVSPFVIRILAEQTGRIGESSGKVFAVSTLGSILGVFLATLVFVPALGSRMTILLFSGMLSGIGLVMYFWPSPAAAVALLMALPLLLPQAPFKADDSALAEWESGYQYIQVTEEDGTRYLKLNEGLDSFHSILVQGSDLTGAYYDYYAVFPYLFAGRDALRVAILGGGGGTSALQYRQFFADRFDLSIDSVEIDPLVSEVGRRYFEYPGESDGVRVHDLDGRVFVNLARGAVAGDDAGLDYDIVIVDAYANQVYIPFHLATREFFLGIREMLGDHGVVAMNVSAFAPDTPLVEALVDTVAEVFPTAYATLVPRSRNLVLFGVIGIGPEEIEAVAGQASGTPLAPVAAAIAYGSRPARDVFPLEGREPRVLTDAHAPVEWLTDQMVLRRVREVLR